jgi:hypothetical protein
MPPRELVSDAAVTQRYRSDDALSLKPCDRAKHRRVVGGKACRKDPQVQVLDRPVVTVAAFKQLPNRVANVAWACDGRKPSRLCKQLALRGEGQRVRAGQRLRRLWLTVAGWAGRCASTGLVLRSLYCQLPSSSNLLVSSSRMSGAP